MLIILIFVFAFGLTIGSFLNCLIWRLHENQSLLGRSCCPKCNQQIAWYDNLPVASFIWLGGKCRQCGQAISWQYPIVEFITGLLFVLTVICNLKFVIWNPEFNGSFLMTNYKLLITIIRDWFLISVMIVVFVYDLRWYLILDIVALPACAIILILNLLISALQCGQCFQWSSLWNLLISGIIGGGFFLIQFIISRGRWIGGGDIRLGLLIGLALGWPGIMVAIMISYFIGSIVGLGLIIAGKKQWKSQVPLGIFLAIGTVITLFWQTPILDWYWNLFL